MPRKKKSKKVAIPVNKTTFKRVEARTHTMEKALKLEGRLVTSGEGVPCVVNPINRSLVPLAQAELHIRKPAGQTIKLPKSTEAKYDQSQPN
jgi:hypothetical protein